MTLRISKFIILTSFFLMIISAAQPVLFNNASAAENSDVDEEETESLEDTGDDLENKEISLEDIDKMPVNFHGRTYQASNLQNMSKLYWRFGLPSVTSQDDVNMYFRLHECEIYKKFSYNEFEWHPIFTTMVDYLKKSSETFNNKFYFVFPIALGEYEFETSQFPVKDELLKNGIRKFMPENDSEGWSPIACGIDQVLKDSYPHNIIIQFQRPLFVDYVAATRSQGTRMVERWKSNFTVRTSSTSLSPTKRFAYMRVYMTFIRLQREKTDIAKPIEKNDDANAGERGAQDVVGLESSENAENETTKKQEPVYETIPLFIANVDGYEIFETPMFDVVLDSRSFLRK